MGIRKDPPVLPSGRVLAINAGVQAIRHIYAERPSKFLDMGYKSVDEVIINMDDADIIEIGRSGKNLGCSAQGISSNYMGTYSNGYDA